jgi:hypothetical protein
MFREELFRNESGASASQNRKEIQPALQGNRQPHEVRLKLTMINRITKFAAMFALVASLASIALAQQVRVYSDGGAWVQEITGSLAGARNLHVKVDMGSVRVQGSSQAEITYVIRNRSYDSGEQQSRREFDAYKISASTRGDTAMVVGNWQGGRHKICSSEFVINVPKDLDFAKLETSGGGNIEVRQCGGGLKVSTGGGNIELGDIAGPVEIETGGGSIRLASAKGAVRAETGAGRIELNGVSTARAETGAGGITARFVRASGDQSDSSLETSAGDIIVYLTPDVAISVRASIDLANGHAIHTDFNDIRVTSEGGDWPGPRTMTAEGKLNGGGPTLKVRTATGNIQILRASR